MWLCVCRATIGDIEIVGNKNHICNFVLAGVQGDRIAGNSVVYTFIVVNCLCIFMSDFILTDDALGTNNHIENNIHVLFNAFSNQF